MREIGDPFQQYGALLTMRYALVPLIRLDQLLNSNTTSCWAQTHFKVDSMKFTATKIFSPAIHP